MTRVLIVEDRPEIQTLLRAFTERSGAEADVASDANQARSKMNPTPGLIFVDLGLPGESGIDFVNSLHQRADWKGIPIVFITAHPDGLRRIKEAGLHGIELINKPFRFEQIKNLVQRHLGVSPAASV